VVEIRQDLITGESGQRACARRARLLLQAHQELVAVAALEPV
jgi:predicted N-formylglutamate amidohydrolase